MKRSTWLSVGMIAAVMILMTVVASAATASEDFSDIDEKTMHYQAIDALYQKGIINGTPDGSFNPENSIYRGHAALMIYRALDLEPGDVEASSFEDFRNDEEENQAIAAMYEQGMIDGYSETEFGLRDYISRGQVAKIIVDAYDIPKDVEDQSFSDVGDTYYDEHINAMAAAGIVQGVGNNEFGVDRDVRRSDFSKMLKGAMDYVNESDESNDDSGNNDDSNNDDSNQDDSNNDDAANNDEQADPPKVLSIE
ncbi:hypothetical protein ABID56_001115 [Alkalibacillus flavidus]|uniref:SLH domain-containing protein n=1 Tax=Alkalibacillus flavidus TaxID=546021 RepID=A0ABV2KWF9_9BACI